MMSVESFDQEEAEDLRRTLRQHLADHEYLGSKGFTLSVAERYRVLRCLLIIWMVFLEIELFCN